MHNSTTQCNCFFVSLFMLASFGLLSLVAAAKEPDVLSTEKQIEFFENQVRPILTAKCIKCHGGEAEIRGDLRLTTRASILKGGESGPAIEPGNPDGSLLIEAINYAGNEMPPTGKLPPASIEILTRWVAMGAPWKLGDDLTPQVTSHGPPPVNDETKQFWSFQKVQRPPVPNVKYTEWVRNPIDAFILAKLEANQLKPVGLTNKTELLRRAYYDLIGLPPTPEEVAEFLADQSASAFEIVIDRLLESPHYGEKWGRHWLDLVRYAETNSYERDGAKPFVWRYRDYVIRSLNADKPYDQFVREQIAGDEFNPVTADSMIATGYYRLGTWQDEPVDHEQELFEDLDDLTRTTGEVFLGLTVGCARCHDHKLDPIPQRDYYRFLAFFRNVNRYGDRSHDSVLAASVREVNAPADDEEYQKQIAAHKERINAAERELESIEALVKDKFAGVEKEDFVFETNRLAIMKSYIGKGLDEGQFRRYENATRRRNELRDNPPSGNAKVLCVTERGPNAPETFVLMRGNAHARADLVSPGFLSVLSPPEPQIAPMPDVKSSGRRTALANWIASPDNPLTARVMANRLWQYHFGRGIVRSSNNFGFQGDAPTHPELLDWLAAEFVEGGWKLKRMHKLIMMSAAYQMSSQADEVALAKDPENNLFWRFDMRRLAAEEIRDSILAVNGSLNDKMFGPSIYPVIADEVKQGQSRPGEGWHTSNPEERNRRSVYIHTKRSLIVPMIAAFDGPDVDATCPVRFITTQPTQALGMINGEFLNGEARVFGDYLRAHVGDDPNQQVTVALRRALQRDPTETEVDRGLALLKSLKQTHGVDPNRALDYYCLVVLNLNEFIYLD